MRSALECKEEKANAKEKLTPLQIVGHVLHTAILGVLAVVMAVLLFAANVILPGYARMVNAMLGYKNRGITARCRRMA